MLKYVSRDFKVMTVLNGTLDGKYDMDHNLAYQVKYSQLPVSDSKIATCLKVVCTHQNSIVKGFNAIMDTLLMRPDRTPNFPQINSEIFVAPLTDKDPDSPLRVYFAVNTQLITVVYTVTFTKEISLLISCMGSLSFICYVLLNLVLKSYGQFQLQTKLLRSFYSVDKCIDGHKIDKKENDVRLSLAEMLHHRKDY